MQRRLTQHFYGLAENWDLAQGGLEEPKQEKQGRHANFNNLDAEAVRIHPRPSAAFQCLTASNPMDTMSSYAVYARAGNDERPVRTPSH